MFELLLTRVHRACTEVLGVYTDINDCREHLHREYQELITDPDLLVDPNADKRGVDKVIAELSFCKDDRAMVMLDNDEQYIYQIVEVQPIVRNVEEVKEILNRNPDVVGHTIWTKADLAMQLNEFSFKQNEHNLDVLVEALNDGLYSYENGDDYIQYVINNECNGLLQEMKATTHIDWDVDDPNTLVNLPQHIEIPDDVQEENIADWLSDTYGYCVKSWY